MKEAVTWSFISEKQALAFGGGQAQLKLVNPISADMSVMRPSLLPGLLVATQRNADRGFPDLAFLKFPASTKMIQLINNNVLLVEFAVEQNDLKGQGAFGMVMQKPLMFLMQKRMHWLF